MGCIFIIKTVKSLLTLIAITCEGDVKALQDDLDAVVEWSVNNNMTLHEDKFEYICHSANRFTCGKFYTV